jgi:cation:H+ antiporter
MSVRWGQAHPAGEPFLQEAEQADIQSAGWNLGKAVLGLALVVLASHVLILSVRELAMHWGVPKAVVAATIVALGTSLPELAVGIASIRKGHAELLVGNVIGADILNVLFVVGASAVAHPLKILEPGTSAPAVFLYVHLPTMLGALLLMRLYIFASLRRGHFARWYGVPLLALYGFYAVVQYGVSL